MDLKKQSEFFDPITLDDEIHIIGLGAIGSTVCEMLTRMGVTGLHIYDFDIVNPHNLANQNFFDADINSTKVSAVRAACKRINPAIKLYLHTAGYGPGMNLAGYIFLCVDNIDLRRTIVEEHAHNPFIKAMFDFRMGLTDAQHYAADWENSDSIKNFLASMNFTHEEAKENMPTSACGTALNIISTVRGIVSFGLANWVNFVKTGKIKKVILMDAFKFTVDAF